MSEKREDNLVSDALALMNDDSVVHIKDATERNGEYTDPFSIGFNEFDEAMKGGVRYGDLIGVAGKPKAGKTSVIQEISLRMAKNGNKCLWFSYELSIDNFYAKFKELGKNIDKLHIYCPKKMSSGNLHWIQEKIIESEEKYGCKFVFIDHLDFIAPKKKQNFEAMRLIKDEICLELKRMAVDLEIVIFLITHVRKVSGRNIELNDIAESGAVGKLSDFVFAVERESHEEYVGGKKTELFGQSSTIRMMANRLTGDCPIVTFTINNGRICEAGKIITAESEDELEVVDYKKPLFGMID